MKRDTILDMACEFYITKGQWRSYNTMLRRGRTIKSKTTALGDIMLKFHGDFYQGIKNGAINWRME